MPHRSFGTVRTAAEREPITFDFGLWGEETFTVIPTPSLGDTFDLFDAPDPTPETELASVRLLAKFVRRMLPAEDRPRFDAALYRIPSDQSFLIVDCANYIAEQVTGFPTVPPTTSSRGRQPAGKTSRRSTGGNGRSKR